MPSGNMTGHTVTRAVPGVITEKNSNPHINPMSQLLHGVPLHEWIGRMMKGEGPGRGKGRKARNPVKIIGFHNRGKIAEVHPSGHKGMEFVELDKLLPWWTRNDDLRKKYKITEEDEEDSVIHESESLIQANRLSINLGIGGPSIRREKPEPLASPQPEPEPVKAFQSAIPLKPAAPAEPNTTPMGIKKIIVDPNASDTWMEDLKDLKESITHKREADQKVVLAQKEADEAAELVKSYASSLTTKGVTIEWDMPEAPEPAPKKTGSRSRTEMDIPEKDLAIVRNFRSHLIKQMVVGRSYCEEDLRLMLNALAGTTFTKLLNHTFRGHPRLHRVQGNRFKPTSYSIVS
jgi:hypothetical protein